ncbi:restriction endonuclease subunit S [Moraxella catarrhalis]|nr:restriction endonuclease subunit S [Moraxella catarrhalis]
MFAEQQALADFENGKVQWGEFRIGDLFDIQTSKKRFDANKVTILEIGRYPYVVRTALNNGIKGYIEEDTQFLNEGNTISFGQDTATVFYQEKPYFTGDKIKIIKSKNNFLSRINAQFILAMMAKSFAKFAWGSSSFKVAILENVIIQLPTKNGEIDFDFMETLISAIQKLVIKDVVSYADKKIAATKQAMGKG